MAMSRNARNRKAKTLAPHKPRPIIKLTVNRRPRRCSTVSATLSNRSTITNERGQRVPKNTPERQLENNEELPAIESMTAQTNIPRSPELPAYDMRAPVSSTATITTISRKVTAANTRQYPAPTHGRANPYVPTPQKGGFYAKERGNPPAGVGDAAWTKAYNNANSYIYNRTATSTRIAVAKNAREQGLTRDLCVEGLIAKGALSADFVDANP